MTKEQRKKRVGKILIDCEKEYALVMSGEGMVNDLWAEEAKLHDFIESEVEKAKKEGTKEGRKQKEEEGNQTFVDILTEHVDNLKKKGLIP